ncbi:MAG TPA: DUF4255 domain-containing protein [Candidatus Agathobaculum merdavium]|nr:DUF4255 domain-containing protein [Candidatus Agathobaculum merdavium]
MADYPIIADVSNYIVRMLREKMCPEPIPSPNNIEVSTPAESDVDYILGLYLYDVREEGEVAVPAFVSSGRTRLRRPSRPYSLYYMLFLNGSSQMGLKGGDVQKIIGRAAQIINDSSSVSPRALQSWLEDDEPPIIFSPARMSLEDKVRVWSAINKPYQVSLFYKAAPVFLSSEIIVDTPRVIDAEIRLNLR